MTQIEPFVGNVSKRGEGWEAPSRQARWASVASQVKMEGEFWSPVRCCCSWLCNRNVPCTLNIKMKRSCCYFWLFMGPFLSARLLGACTFWDWGRQDCLRLGPWMPVPMSSAQLDWNLRAALCFILPKIGITLLFFFFFLPVVHSTVLWDLWMNSTTWNQHFVQIPGWYADKLLAGGQTSQEASVQFTALCWGWQFFVDLFFLLLSTYFPQHTCWFGGNERSGGVKRWD